MAEKTIVTLHETEIEAKATLLKKLEAEMDNLKAQIELEKSALKDQLVVRGTDKLKAGIFTISRTTYERTFFDSTALKKEDIELYNRYAKTATCERFIVRA